MRHNFCPRNFIFYHPTHMTNNNQQSIPANTSQDQLIPSNTNQQQANLNKIQQLIIQLRYHQKQQRRVLWELDCLSRSPPENSDSEDTDPPGVPWIYPDPHPETQHSHSRPLPPFTKNLEPPNCWHVTHGNTLPCCWRLILMQPDLSIVGSTRMVENIVSAALPTTLNPWEIKKCESRQSHGCGSWIKQTRTTAAECGKR